MVYYTLQVVVYSSAHFSSACYQDDILAVRVIERVYNMIHDYTMMQNVWLKHLLSGYHKIKAAFGGRSRMLDYHCIDSRMRIADMRATMCWRTKYILIMLHCYKVCLDLLALLQLVKYSDSASDLCMSDARSVGKHVRLWEQDDHAAEAPLTCTTARFRANIDQGTIERDCSPCLTRNTLHALTCWEEWVW